MDFKYLQDVWFKKILFCVTNYTFFLLFYFLIIGGWDCKRLCVLESLCFSLFLAGPEISPLWLPFSLIASFQRLLLSSFVSFSPWNDAFQDCHLDSCALLGLFLICQYRDLPRLYSVLYFRLTFFPAMVSNPFLTSFSLSSFLLYAVFPGLVPKVWHTALLGLGINFFFTYRWFEDSRILYLLVILRVWVLYSFTHSSC